MADTRSASYNRTNWGLASTQPLATAAGLRAGDRFFQTNTGIWQVLQDDNAGNRVWVDLVVAGYVFQDFKTSNADGSGAPGNIIQNVLSGRVAIAIGASTVVVTNSKVIGNTSRVLITSLGVLNTGAEDATATRFWLSALQAGSFTIKTNANATAVVVLVYLVIN